MSDIIPLWEHIGENDHGQYEALGILLRAWGRNSRPTSNSALQYKSLHDRILKKLKRTPDDKKSSANYISRLARGQSASIAKKNWALINEAIKIFIDLKPGDCPEWRKTQPADVEKCWLAWERAWEFSERVFSLKRAYQDYQCTDGTREFDTSLLRYGKLQSTRVSMASLCHKHFDHDDSKFVENAKAFGIHGETTHVTYACFRLAGDIAGNVVRTRLIFDLPEDDFKRCRFINLADSEKNKTRDSEGLVLELDKKFHLIGKMISPDGIFSKTFILSKPTKVTKAANETADGLVLSRSTYIRRSLASRVFIVRETDIDEKDDWREYRDHLKAFPITELDKNIDGIEHPAGSDDLVDKIMNGISNVDLGEKAIKTLRDKLGDDYATLEKALQKAIVLH